jgi:hypothetical protein
MLRHMKKQVLALIAMGTLVVVCGSCALQPSSSQEPLSKLGTNRSALDLQSLVMKMADDYGIALTDAMRPIIMDESSDPSARQLAQWFQRNGFGSAIDIAAGPNPDTSLLDMLVLVSLQRWAFNAHWIARGIPVAHAAQAAERLRIAEAAAWESASTTLTDAQQQTLRGLIDAWIKANPDRSTVSFVRFAEFVDLRNDQTLSTRTDAQGLLREISEATATVDAARLLGERTLWFASRYPFVLGQQAELTVYRLADQPETRSAVESIEAVKELSRTISAKVQTLDLDLQKQQELLFAKLAAERVLAIEQMKAGASEITRAAIVEVDARATVARQAAVSHVFDRFAEERKSLLDDLQAREGTIRDALTELRSAASASTGLAKELTGTATTIDRLVARFDPHAASDRKPLDIKDFRDAAAEAAKAAEMLALLLERANQQAGSGALAERLASLQDAGHDLIDRAFWRGLALIFVLLAGLALLRFVKPRAAG